MNHTPVAHNNRKLHGALLIAMLLLFAVVYNRRWIMGIIDPQPVAAYSGPGAQRAAHPWNKTRADSCVYLVRNGDLVLRSGSDPLSALFKKINRKDKIYSHAGIVFLENGYPFVYHCTGAADDPYALLQRDSLAAYIGPSANLGYAVYRYKLSRH